MSAAIVRMLGTLRDELESILLTVAASPTYPEEVEKEYPDGATCLRSLLQRGRVAIVTEDDRRYVVITDQGRAFVGLPAAQYVVDGEGPWTLEELEDANDGHLDEAHELLRLGVDDELTTDGGTSPRTTFRRIR